MMRRLLFILLIPATVLANGVGSRFAYLAEDDPYYPHGDFPKFTTPAWVGEPDVEAVVVLSIDDMCRPFPKQRPKGLPTYARQPKVYFDFLKPIADRLMEIDGRAPISVFCLQLDPDDKIVQQMLEMGMSMECHTFTHPVPLMRAALSGDDSLALVKADYLRSSKSLFGLLTPDWPIAHRTPGCDARNTASPRFFTEVFPLAPLQMDSSIFTAYLKPDSKLPREWYFKSDGTHRFASRITGIPYTKKFVNYVEDYPYPYVINGRIWELPAIIPGDAHGVHAYGRMSDETVEDWKRALDITFAKQGVMTICFHPHGYIDSKQMVAFIDYAERTYGKQIKFLNCREVMQRIEHNALNSLPPAPIRLADINADGHLDVIHLDQTRIWNPRRRSYKSIRSPMIQDHPNGRFLSTDRLGRAGFAYEVSGELKVWHFSHGNWFEAPGIGGFEKDAPLHCRDLNGDGVSDIISGSTVHLSTHGMRWKKASFQLPRPLSRSMRFVDIDHDQDDDLIFADENEYAIWLFQNPTSGWSQQLLSGVGAQDAVVPPITINGKNAGVWFQKDEMVVVNEFTANPKADHLIIRKYSDWLQRRNN